MRLQLLVLVVVVVVVVVAGVVVLVDLVDLVVLVDLAVLVVVDMESPWNHQKVAQNPQFLTLIFQEPRSSSTCHKVLLLPIGRRRTRGAMHLKFVRVNYTEERGIRRRYNQENE